MLHQWQDATRPLKPDMILYPGSNPFVRTTVENGPWRISDISMCVHCGTHMDAPLHISAGDALESIPVSMFTGMLTLVDSDVTPIAKRMAIKNHRGLTVEEAQAIADYGVEFLCVDTLSVAPTGIDEYEIHLPLLSKGVVILENAALEAFAPGQYGYIATPISIPGSDGAPARFLLAKA